MQTEAKATTTMNTKIKISDTQAAVLKLAVKTQGRIEQFPENVNGGARSKVLRALIAAGLVENQDEGCWLTDAGYAAIGEKRPEPTPAEVPPAKSTKTSKNAAPDGGSDQPRRTRENSKQAQVIAMLRRPEGATIAQICAATHWQQHTVRGTFAGAFKKKLGLTVTSTKDAGGDRVYRITEEGGAP